MMGSINVFHLLEYSEENHNIYSEDNQFNIHCLDFHSFPVTETVAKIMGLIPRECMNGCTPCKSPWIKSVCMHKCNVDNVRECCMVIAFVNACLKIMTMYKHCKSSHLLHLHLLLVTLKGAHMFERDILGLTLNLLTLDH